MALIKNIYTREFYQFIADQFHRVDSNFDRQKFIKRIFAGNFNEMEWKQRTKHSTATLHEFMPTSFSEAASLLRQVVRHLMETNHRGGLEYVIFPDYIETYGIDDFETAVQSFEIITQFITCEFAVRPFIIKYGARMLSEMEKWSQSPHPQVRRLASEGSRPRLPWAMAIPSLKNDPAPILSILENLNNDPSDSVRRSVANNLNDIAKDHPHLVLSIAKKWNGISKNTDAIIKHGSRTLLKQGQPEILHFYGLDSRDFQVKNFSVHTPTVKIGDHLIFSFQITNGNSVPKSLRLEYGLYYKKSNGQLARKVFKISERIYQGAEINYIERKQSFKLITTRKFYAGTHQISIIVNGLETGRVEFELLHI